MRVLPATFPQFLAIGFVGARRLGSDEAAGDEIVREAALRRRIDQILDHLGQKLRAGESLVAVSALAAGADTIFAEAVAAHGIWHQVFLPQTPDVFFNKEDFFDSEAGMARSERLAQGSNVIEVRVTSDALERRSRFAECGYRIVNECDLLIVVARADEDGKPGGTLETLAYARSIGRPVIEIVLQGDLTVTGLEGVAFPKRAEDFFTWPLPIDPEAPQGSLAAVVALKDYASAEARRHKMRFRNATGFVLFTNVAATVVADWSLAGFPHGIGQRWAKALLLLVGTGVYFGLRRLKPQRRWVKGRLAAELCRSVYALRRLPGHLGYLRNLRLPHCEHLVRSLEILHLRATRDPRHPPADFIQNYLHERLGGEAKPNPDAQIDYYLEKAAGARHLRAWLQGGFYVFSTLAFICAAYYVQSGIDKTLVTNWDKLIFSFAPATFPIIAAAAASWVSILDLDRRVDRYVGMVEFLRQQRQRLPAAAGDTFLRNGAHATEQALLREVLEWHTKHTSESGG
jgi:hypothetical protein